MKKFWFLLCTCFLMMAFPASAADDFKLEAEVLGTRLLGTWEGETSEENDWFVVDLELTNWHTDTQTISELLSGQLLYKEVYRFEGVPVFDSETIKPLVEKKGVLLFEIPKIVSRTFGPEDVEILITADGENKEVEAGLSVMPYRRSGTLEGSGYDTSEEAVLAYLEGMNNADPSAMLSTFAIETYVDHMDTEGYLRRMNAYSLASTNTVPFSDGYSKTLMALVVYGNLAKALHTQYAELTFQTEGRTISLRDEASLLELLDAFDTSVVNSWQGKVVFVGWEDPNAISQNFYTDRNLLNMARIIACAGGDDYAELAAHIKLDGIDAIQLMQCVKYGDRWYNLTFQSDLASLLSVSTLSGGLLYPLYDVDFSAIEDADPESEEEVRYYLESWEKSGLAGSSWKLESITFPVKDVTIAESVEEVLNDAGNSIYARLKFMHLGGVFLDFRVSQPLAEGFDAGSTYLSSVALWTEQDGELKFETSGGFGNSEYVDLEYISECSLDEDVLTIRDGDEVSMTFRREP